MYLLGTLLYCKLEWDSCCFEDVFFLLNLMKLDDGTE